jgi:hypothetical protein
MRSHRADLAEQVAVGQSRHRAKLMSDKADVGQADAGQAFGTLARAWPGPDDCAVDGICQQALERSPSCCKLLEYAFVL